MLGSLCTEIIGSKIAVLDSRFICPSNRQPSINTSAAAEACHDYSQLFLLYFLPQVSTQLRLLTHTHFIYQSEGATWPRHTWNRKTAATLCLLKAKRGNTDKQSDSAQLVCVLSHRSPLKCSVSISTLYQVSVCVCVCVDRGSLL